MAKEPPIQVVNKPRSRKKTSGKGRRQTKKKQGFKPPFQMPVWLHYLLTGVVSVCIILGFYWFFIRPYAYRWKPCYGLKAYGVCIPYGYGVHQGHIDWAALSEVQHTPFPIRFVFMKASEGGDFSDTAFVHNFNEARKNGFIRGAYHFYNPKTDALRQADFFIRSVKLEPGDLPPVLDIETRSDNMDKLRRDLKIWLRRIENYYKVKPILYTSYKFKTRYLNDSVFNSYPYWIAHYYVDSVEYQGEWKFWQHTDVGRLPGIDEQVDLNVFNGSMEELKSMTIPDTLRTDTL